MIPEISLTPQLIDRLNARFPGRVGILHSALSGSERRAQWWQIVRGNVDVVVGARSAVFAPLANLGLMIVDEEHDPSYKQEEGFRYNGRDVAVMRGKLSTCPVILGSATPAMESYQNSLDGRIDSGDDTARFNERPCLIETVDLRSKFIGSQPPNGGKAPLQTIRRRTPSGEHRLISDRLAALLRKNYQASRQSLIFSTGEDFPISSMLFAVMYCAVPIAASRSPFIGNKKAFAVITAIFAGRPRRFVLNAAT
jgi:primosomal protein N'